MECYQPVVICTGPSSEAFEELFFKTGICDVRFVQTNGWVELAEVLYQNPCAVVIVEFQDKAEHFFQVLRDFNKAVVIGFTDDSDLADNLTTDIFFDVVLGSDPVWRFVNVMRNAVKQSALIEFWSCAESKMDEHNLAFTKIEEPIRKQKWRCGRFYSEN